MLSTCRGLVSGDKKGMMARLNAQGVTNLSNISNFGVENNTTPATRADAASIVNRLRNKAEINRFNRSPTKSPSSHAIITPSAVDIAVAGPGGTDGPPAIRGGGRGSRGLGGTGLGVEGALTGATFSSMNRFVQQNNGAPMLSGSGNSIKSGYPGTSKTVDADAGLLLLMEKLKMVLKSRGDQGYTSLQRVFEDMDKDGNRSLSIIELKHAMRNLDIVVTEPELRRLFEFFDKDKNGTIDYSEFVGGLREPLSSTRFALVDMVFAELDITGTYLPIFLWMQQIAYFPPYLSIYKRAFCIDINDKFTFNYVFNCNNFILKKNSF